LWVKIDLFLKFRINFELTCPLIRQAGWVWVIGLTIDWVRVLALELINNLVRFRSSIYDVKPMDCNHLQTKNLKLGFKKKELGIWIEFWASHSLHHGLHTQN